LTFFYLWADAVVAELADALVDALTDELTGELKDGLAAGIAKNAPGLPPRRR